MPEILNFGGINLEHMARLIVFVVVITLIMGVLSGFAKEPPDDVT